MATQLQIRRGTSSQVAAFTGAEGEVVVNTTNDSIHVNDGSTAGGFEMARVDGSNWAITNNITTTANIDVGTVTANGIITDDDQSALTTLGRFSSGFAYSLIRPSTNSTGLEVRTFAGNALARFLNSGVTELYHNGSLKLSTGANGIGIGTSSPSQALHVSNAASMILNESTTSWSFLRLKSPSANGGYIQFADAEDDDVGQIFYYHGSGGDYMSFTTNASEAMRITGAGHTTFGTTDLTPANNSVNGTSILSDGRINHNAQSQAALTVGRTGTNGDLVDFKKNGTTVGTIGNRFDALYIHSPDGTNGAGLRFFDGVIQPCESNGNDSNGDTDLGQTNSRFRDLHLSRVMYSNTARINTTTSRSGAAVNVRAGSGGIQVIFQNSATTTIGYIGNVSDSSTLYATSSDERLKTNIADSVGAGSKIDAIQVRQFDWKIDGAHQDYGMVAQELQAVAPEAVLTPENPDDMMAVDYSKLVPMLVKEIQSLRARVAQLEK